MIEEKVTIHHGKLKRIPVILQFGPRARVVAVSSARLLRTGLNKTIGLS